MSLGLGGGGPEVLGPQRPSLLNRNLLDNLRGLSSDSGEDEEEDFVPSKRELESSEEEDEEEEEESEEDVAAKRRRPSFSSPPRSRRSLAPRTPRRTPNKVSEEETPRTVQTSASSRGRLHFFVNRPRWV